ncbi:potassium channel protein related protein, partial [mine drainage metagenome]
MVILISPIIEKRIGGLVEVLKRQQIGGLKNFTLVCGYSSLSEYLNEVKKRGGVVIVMTKDEKDIEALKHSGFLILDEDPGDETALQEFDFGETRAIIVASEDDGNNLLIATSFFQLQDQE